MSLNTFDFRHFSNLGKMLNELVFRFTYAKTYRNSYFPLKMSSRVYKEITTN